MINKFELRTLKEKDALLMYEWMHDPDVVKNLKTDFQKKTIEDCQNFIITSLTDEKNVSYAIVNEQDEYLGTVSLKNVNRTNSCAEFAIAIRKSAMGTGCSTYAIKEIIRKGFEEFNLKYIYWYVDKENKRAIRFYDKNNFKRIPFLQVANICNLAEDENNENFIWYMETKDNY